MTRTLAAVILITLLLGSMTGVSAEKIYFGDIGHQKIRRCQLSGFNIEELVTTGLDAVGSIAIDRTGGKMYWADWPEATACIKRANLDGTDIETILSGLHGPYGVALDVASGKIYWTEFSVNKIRRANLDGSGAEDLIIAGLSHPNGIALDLDTGKMYWTEGALYGKIMRSNLNGTSIEELITSGPSVPMEIALDLDGGKMYWADLGTDSLYRADLDGSNLEAIIYAEYGSPVGVDLDLDAGKIYYSDSGGSDSKIYRANLDGTGIEALISSGIGACYGLTLGPDEAECSGASLAGPWLGIISGVEPYTYAAYMIFDGENTITDLGSFNVPDSAGSYAVEPNCDYGGYLWTDGYSPFTGHIYSDTTADMDLGGGAFPLIKVQNVAALEGCWEGSFAQGSPVTVYNVTLNIDSSGSIQSNSGFPGPATGKLFFDSGYLAGHIICSQEIPNEWGEINIRNATVINDSAMTGGFALDCSGCADGTLTLIRCDLTGIGDETPLSSSMLYQNYPNPFNPLTTITYELSAPGKTTLRIYDTAGRLVTTLVDEVKSAGNYGTTWDGRNDAGRMVSSGIYFMRLESGGEAHARKMVLLK